MILQLLFQAILLLLPWPRATSSLSTLRRNCQSSCGNNVTIPFPFGIGENCYFDHPYAIVCKSNKPFLKSIDLEVLEFSTENSAMRVNHPVISTCQDQSVSRSLASLENFPFYFSDDSNVLTGVGCHNLALLFDDEFILGGCFSMCKHNGKLPDQSHKSTDGDLDICSGILCCQTKVPLSFKSCNISVNTLTWPNETRSSRQQDKCRYAFLVEYKWFRTKFKSLKDVQNWKEVPLVLEWGMYNSSFSKLASAQSPLYRLTSHCEINKVSGLFKCHCYQGYEGNPYFLQGCQDIDECKARGDSCKSHMVCENFDGGFRCNHPKKLEHIITISGIGSGLLGFFLIAGAWRLRVRIKKRNDIKLKEKFFERNGGILLQQQLTSSEGTVARCKLFTAKELDKATDHFNMDRVLGQGGQGTVYKGMLADGRIVAVKKSKVVDEGKLDEFINEVVILSQTNHRNVIKLLGCCLETEVPLLVYEYIPNGTLSDYLHEQNEDFPLTWAMRLRIATEAAGALSYLHSAAAIPIYHRDVKSTNILLDEKFRAKIADFGTSKCIDIDQTHVTTKVLGTFGYLDPEYFRSSQFTDKSDVYSFGVVLVELLTGRKPIFSTGSEEATALAAFFILSLEENHLFEFLDAQVIKGGREEEIMVVANLAKRCLNLNGKKRPAMKEVAMELEAVYQEPQKGTGNVQHIYEETIEPSYTVSTSVGSTSDSISLSVDVK